MTEQDKLDVKKIYSDQDKRLTDHEEVLNDHTDKIKKAKICFQEKYKVIDGNSEAIGNNKSAIETHGKILINHGNLIGEHKELIDDHGQEIKKLKDDFDYIKPIAEENKEANIHQEVIMASINENVSGMRKDFKFMFRTLIFGFISVMGVLGGFVIWMMQLIISKG